MNNMKTTVAAIVSTILIIAAVALTGCSTVENALTGSGKPVSTNMVERVESVPVTNSVTLATVTEAPPGSGIFKTNLTTLPVVGSMPVTNYVLVTNYAPHPDYTAAISAAGAAGAAAGFPLAPTIAGTLSTLLAAAYGWRNRRAAQRAVENSNELEALSGVLVENVEAMKKLALDYAGKAAADDPEFKAKVNAYANELLIGAQSAAGVERLVRRLVSEHTGFTRQESGIAPAPEGTR